MRVDFRQAKGGRKRKPGAGGAGEVTGRVGGGTAWTLAGGVLGMSAGRSGASFPSRAKGKAPGKDGSRIEEGRTVAGQVLGLPCLLFVHFGSPAELILIL